MSKTFIKTGNNKCQNILDCAEVFIERPKSLNWQAATWSNYKHHITVKFLVDISPSGFITFLSSCYGGQVSDKFITTDSGFYDLFEGDDVVIADSGFQIKEDLLFHFCNLQVPPGARTKSQMKKREVQKTEETANLQIHDERAINRIKTYRILKGTLPIIMMQHVYEIILICAALCNIKQSIDDIFHDIFGGIFIEVT